MFTALDNLWITYRRWRALRELRKATRGESPLTSAFGAELERRRYEAIDKEARYRLRPDRSQLMED